MKVLEVGQVTNVGLRESEFQRNLCSWRSPSAVTEVSISRDLTHVRLLDHRSNKFTRAGTCSLSLSRFPAPCHKPGFGGGVLPPTPAPHTMIQDYRPQYCGSHPVVDKHWMPGDALRICWSTWDPVLSPWGDSPPLPRESCRDRGGEASPNRIPGNAEVQGQRVTTGTDTEALRCRGVR